MATEATYTMDERDGLTFIEATEHVLALARGTPVERFARRDPVVRLALKVARKFRDDNVDMSDYEHVNYLLDMADKQDRPKHTPRFTVSDN